MSLTCTKHCSVPEQYFFTVIYFTFFRDNLSQRQWTWIWLLLCDFHKLGRKNQQLRNTGLLWINKKKRGKYLYQKCDTKSCFDILAQCRFHKSIIIDFFQLYTLYTFFLVQIFPYKFWKKNPHYFYLFFQ